MLKTTQTYNVGDCIYYQTIPETIVIGKILFITFEPFLCETYYIATTTPFGTTGNVTLKKKDIIALVPESEKIFWILSN